MQMSCTILIFAGDTISIPDSVMGLSFLAVGSSMPEIVSCIIVSKQGIYFVDSNSQSDLLSHITFLFFPSLRIKII